MLKMASICFKIILYSKKQTLHSFFNKRVKNKAFKFSSYQNKRKNWWKQQYPTMLKLQFLPFFSVKERKGGVDTSGNLILEAKNVRKITKLYNNSFHSEANHIFLHGAREQYIQMLQITKSTTAPIYSLTFLSILNLTKP